MRKRTCVSRRIRLACTSPGRHLTLGGQTKSRTMTEAEKKMWERERERGYSRYLLRSLLRAGIPFAIMATLVHFAFSILRHHPQLPLWEQVVRFGFYALAFGWLHGANDWSRNEIHYKQPTLPPED